MPTIANLLASIWQSVPFIQFHFPLHSFVVLAKVDHFAANFAPETKGIKKMVLS
jgi:hypothetical protein